MYMLRWCRKIKDAGLAMAICCMAVLLLVYAKPVANGLQEGMNVCLQTMIPSLFCFLVLGEFSRRAGFLHNILKPIDRFLHRLLALPEGAAELFFFALLGGYAAGARLLADTVAEGKLSSTDGNRLLCIFVFAGPSYLISGVGIFLFHQTAFGVILLVSQLLATFLLGGILLRLYPAIPPIQPKRETEPLTKALSIAVSKAIHTTAVICGFILLFYAVFALVPSGCSESHPVIYMILCGSLEVTRGISACAALPPRIALMAACAISSWCGICIWLQIAAILQKSGMRIGRAVLWRIPYLILSTAFCCLFSYLPFVQSALEAGVQSDTVFNQSTTSAAADIALVQLCLMLLYSLNKNKKETIKDE